MTFQMTVVISFGGGGVKWCALVTQYYVIGSMVLIDYMYYVIGLMVLIDYM